MQRGHSHYCKPQIRKNKGQILWNLDQNKRGGSEIMFLLTLFNSKFNSTFSLIPVSVPYYISVKYDFIFFPVKVAWEIVSYLHLFGAKFFIMSTNFF